MCNVIVRDVGVEGVTLLRVLYSLLVFVLSEGV